ncbi:MAG TPA: SGNH/GDSL hydrolase family protein [Ruminiclostridium sp.]|nr:SGNH/GDSL hydrolase family protein [Ruminiclostridium sp.]
MADYNIEMSPIKADDTAAKGAFTTVKALTEAYPSGNANIYIVTANNHRYYWNGSAWTDGGLYQTESQNLSDISSAIVQKRDLTNKIANGNFADTTNWASGAAYNMYSSLTVTSNILSATGTTTAMVGTRNSFSIFEAGKYYYIHAMVRVTNPDCQSINVGQGTILTMKQINNPVQNHWYEISVVIKTTSAVHDFLLFWATYANAASANGKVMEIKKVSVIDLSSLSSVTCKPLASDIRSIIAASYPDVWFDKTALFDISLLYSGRNLGIKNSNVGLVNCSNLTNKTWVVVDDSISQTPSNRTAKSYQEYISDWVGGCTLENYAVGGTGWFTENSAGANNAIYQRISSLPSSADLITVFAGINDWMRLTNKEELGKYGDTNGAVSFFGAVDSTLSQLIKKYPTSTIAVITPLQSAASFSGKNASGISLSQIDDAIIKECRKYGIPVLDLYNSCGLYPWNPVANAKYFSCPDSPLGDGIHPNEEGHRKIAYQIMDFINKIMG